MTAALLGWLWVVGVLMATRFFQFEDDVRLRFRVPLFLMWPISVPLVLWDTATTKKPAAPDDATG